MPPSIGDNPASMIPDRSASKKDVVPLTAAIGSFAAGLLLMIVAVRPLFAHFGMRGGLAASELVLVLPSLVLAVAVGVGRAGLIGIGRPTTRQWVLTALLSVALWLVAGGLLELQQLVVPFPPELLDQFRALHAALQPKSVWDAVLSVAAIAIAPAVAEELLVRGILLPSLDRAAPRTLALVLSAAAFAGLHLDGYRMGFTFLLGLALGWLRLRSGTLLLPLFVHALFNSITFLVAPFADDGTNATHPVAGLLILLAGLAFGVPLWRALDLSFEAAKTPNGG